MIEAWGSPTPRLECWPSKCWYRKVHLDIMMSCSMQKCSLWSHMGSPGLLKLRERIVWPVLQLIDSPPWYSSLKDSE